MVLKKHSQTWPIVQGIDTKKDEKHLTPPGLLKCENGQFDKLGRISKRPGRSVVDYVPRGASTDWAAASSIISHNSETHVVARTQATGGAMGPLDDWIIATQDPSAADSVEAGRALPLAMDVQTASRASANWEDCDMAENSLYRCYAWAEDTAGGASGYIYISIVEIATGATVISDYSLGTAGMLKPKVIPIDTEFHVWAMVAASNEIWSSVIDTDGGLGAIPATMTNRAMTANATQLWDVCKAEHDTHGECSVVCRHLAAGGIACCWVDGTPTIQQTTNVASLNTPVSGFGCNTIYDSLNSVYKVALAWQHNPGAGLGIYHQLFDSDGSLTWANPILLATNTDNAIQVTMIQDDAYNSGASPQAVRYFVEYDNASFAPALAQWQYIEQYIARVDTGATYGLENTTRHAGLASKAFEADGRARVWAAYENQQVVTGVVANQQPTYFLISSRLDGASDLTDTHAKVFSTNAGGLVRENGLPQVASSGSRHTVAMVREDRLGSEQISHPGAITTAGPRLVTVNGVSVTTGEGSLDRGDLGPSKMLATGGFLASGVGRYAESGFHLIPESLDLGGTTSGGHLTDTTEYFYTAIYEWTDRAGQVYRSGTTTVQSITTGAAAAADDNTVTANVISLTYGDPEKLSQIEIVLYRRASDGIYHRVASELNDPTADRVAVSDVVTDAVALANEVLYTTGGVLDNFGPPATRIMTTGGNLTYIVPEEDKTIILATKPKVSGLGAEFAPELSRRVSDGGATTALGYIGQSVIAFKEREIHAYSGPGPSSTGMGGWTPTRRIAGNVGCSERPSVLNIGLGIMFKSEKGIHLLTPDYQVKYIGAPVADYNSTAIVSSVHAAEQNQARFTLSGGTILVWDYLVNQWSTWTGYSQLKDSEVCGGTPKWIDNLGRTWVEDSGFRDNAVAYSMTLGLGWITPGEAIGAQRVWRVWLLGEYKSPHTLTVKVFYDFQDTESETHTLAFTADPDPYLVEVIPGRQRCNAFRIEVSDGSQTTPFEGFSLSAIKALFGVKRRPALRASRKM